MLKCRFTSLKTALVGSWLFKDAKPEVNEMDCKEHDRSYVVPVVASHISWSQPYSLCISCQEVKLNNYLPLPIQTSVAWGGRTCLLHPSSFSKMKGEVVSVQDCLLLVAHQWRQDRRPNLVQNWNIEENFMLFLLWNHRSEKVVWEFLQQQALACPFLD